MLELKLCKNATFGISPKDITKREDFITYKGETTYTWYDIVSSILHEISWYGTPSNRDIYLDELKDRVDGVDKDLKSGNTSSLMDN